MEVGYENPPLSNFIPNVLVFWNVAFFMDNGLETLESFYAEVLRRKE